MDKLYQKIKIENFEEIKKELFALITEEEFNFKDAPKSWIPDINQVLACCPFLNKFSIEKTKKPIHQIKFYLSPPERAIGPHVDGANIKQPFGLVLPIINTENTFVNWYEDDPHNFDVRHFAINPMVETFKSNLGSVIVPKNADKLRILDSLELVEPTFTKSDIMHGVTNQTNQTRVTVVLRWPHFYKEIEDVIDTTGILYD